MFTYAEFLHFKTLVFDSISSGLFSLLGHVTGNRAQLVPPQVSGTETSKACFLTAIKKKDRTTWVPFLQDWTCPPSSPSYWSSLVGNMCWDKVWLLPPIFLTNKVKEVSFKMLHRFYPANHLQSVKGDINYKLHFSVFLVYKPTPEQPATYAVQILNSLIQELLLHIKIYILSIIDSKNKNALETCHYLNILMYLYISVC